MGLDNGIQIKKHKNKLVNKLLSYTFEYLKYTDEFEAAYFRKCWNIRSLIFDVINRSYNHSLDEWTFPVKQKEIKQIIKSLKSLNEDNWEDEGGCIWTFEEMREHLKADIRRLTVLYLLMFFLDLEVYFYDSY